VISFFEIYEKINKKSTKCAKIVPRGTEKGYIMNNS
jgi:hypothetical protein